MRCARGSTTCVSRHLAVRCSMLQCVAVCMYTKDPYIQGKNKNVHLSIRNWSLNIYTQMRTSFTDIHLVSLGYRSWVYNWSVNIYAYLCIPKIYIFREKHKKCIQLYTIVCRQHTESARRRHVCFGPSCICVYMYISAYTHKRKSKDLFLSTCKCVQAAYRMRAAAPRVFRALSCVVRALVDRSPVSVRLSLSLSVFINTQSPICAYIQTCKQSYIRIEDNTYK